jgi:hypothetical protein
MQGTVVKEARRGVVLVPTRGVGGQSDPQAPDAGGARAQLGWPPLAFHSPCAPRALPPPTSARHRQALLHRQTHGVRAVAEV